MTPEQRAEQIRLRVINRVITENAQGHVVEDINVIWDEGIATVLRQVERETWEKAAKEIDVFYGSWGKKKSMLPTVLLQIAARFRRRSADGK